MIFHDRTARIIETYKKALPQSLLLTGNDGVGLLSAAKYLTENPDYLVLTPLNTKGEIDRANGTITVETIRHLYADTRGKRRTKQVIIIDDADRMSPGAQTAFLKLLEEPNAQTHFILTSHHPGQLLATIRSRVQQVVILPLSTGQATAYLSSLGVTDATKRTQLTFVAAGYPAELYRLAHDDNYFKIRAQSMSDARDMLRKPLYDKLLIIHAYKDDRGRVLGLIDALIMIVRRSLSDSPQSAQVKKLDQLIILRERVGMNANVKLLLTEFVL